VIFKTIIMKRSDFLRNIAGSIAAVIVGSKLEPLVSTPSDLPGVGGTAFQVVVQKNWIRQYDVLRTAEGRTFYVIREGEKLFARDISDLDVQVELIETESPHQVTAVRMCSAVPEIQTL
jgi:hypothetical protein